MLAPKIDNHEVWGSNILLIFSTGFFSLTTTSNINQPFIRLKSRVFMCIYTSISHLLAT